MTTTDELPPLPEPHHIGHYGVARYSTCQMEYYATAARAPLLAELDALRERAESAERDAQRYRAFFDSGPSVCFMGRDYTNKAECDAAIDAAIKGSKNA